jgi:uncharacterized pyridoxamine 5'-phosphate oxidase family protein
LNPNEKAKLKDEIFQYFVEQQPIFLATIEGNQPRVRPVTLIYLRDDFYVATGSSDAKTSQIQKNPRVEFGLLVEKGESRGTIRAECIASLVKDTEIRTHIFEKIPFMKEFFKTPKDPKYALIKLEPKAFEYMKPGSIQSQKINL